MARIVSGIIAIVVAAFVSLHPNRLWPSTAAAQHPAHGSHAPGGDAPHRRMQATLDEIDRVIADGRGAGLAFAADQNGYPGPLHVLELKEHLRLTPVQEARITALLNAMFAEARPKSARLLEAEGRLRRLFAEGAADEARVRAALVEVEHARTEVRLVHLLTHLQTRAVLSDEQRRLYHEARWGR